MQNYKNPDVRQMQDDARTALAPKYRVRGARYIDVLPETDRRKIINRYDEFAKNMPIVASWQPTSQPRKNR